jgi:hypothetical protein
MGPPEKGNYGFIETPTALPGNSVRIFIDHVKGFVWVFIGYYYIPEKMGCAHEKVYGWVVAPRGCIKRFDFIVSNRATTRFENPMGTEIEGKGHLCWSIAGSS